MAAKRIEGVLTALLTPVDEKGNLNKAALRKLIRHLLEKGIHGFYPCGTTGEWPFFTVKERKKIAEIVMDETPSRKIVIIHAGALRFDETIELAKHAVDVGADGVGIVTPFYYKFDDEALYNYYSEIAKKIDGNIYLYNIPQLTGVKLNASLIKRLVEEHSNIVGLKDSSDDFIYLLEILRVLKGKINVFVGSENLFLPALNFDARGTISSLSNVFPEMLVGIYKNFKEKNTEEALKLQFKVIKIGRIIGIENRPAKLKMILNYMGLKIGEDVKFPLKKLNVIEKTELITNLREEQVL
ncbi:MAG: dihydrodipicolinate synthase family protein [Candidatus Njordarchaeia archaeon]